MTQFRFVALTPSMGRTPFTCGKPALDTYLKQHVSQDVKRDLAKCFVALAPDDSIAGFYTLSAASVPLDDLPAALVNKLPRDPVPVALMGRLAVHTAHAGHGLGVSLIFDAAARVMASDIGMLALMVDATDDDAKRFYEHLGFVPLTDKPHTLVIALSVLRKALGKP
ncbi:GNAT family N-acetyltransferase [Pandoraea oxalativorans]|uniref:N-acetyltransferase domain-containing protein n=1 Tax=Pandoraea oxalativorans TaxID=573737 RepID=A0A0G3IBY9_9BURK|nr:GNAT family N-acetyltransferase [Pandoraea oxalativorans]AKK24724.1 hypothetical protein MB84_28330 [Pandoraea oxalativorans]